MPKKRDILDLLNKTQLEGLLLLMWAAVSEAELNGGVGISESLKYKESMKPYVMNYVSRFNLDKNDLCRVILNVLNDMDLIQVRNGNTYNFNKLQLIKKYGSIK